MSCPFRAQLESFAAGTLDAEPRRAVLAHLPSCPACREEAARLASLRALVSHLSPYEPADAEWQRIDRAVLSAMDEALDSRRNPAISSGGWLERWAPAFSLAAAAAAVLLLTVATPRALRPAPAAAAAWIRAAPSGAVAVELGEGVQVFEPCGSGRPFAAGTVDEGDHLAVARAPLTLQTGPATGVRLAPGTQLDLDRLALGYTALRLAEGGVAAEVKPLGAGERFEVRAADLLVSVRGTAFQVVREEGRTRIEVAHGLVSVEREGGGGALLVPGPGRVEIVDGEPLSAERVERSLSEDTAAAFPLALPDRPLEEIAAQPPRWLEAPPPAPVSAQAEPTMPGATAAAPAVATAATAPRPAARALGARTAELRETFGDCLREPSRLGALERCYDDALKRDLGLSGKLVLSVSIDPTGAVRSVEASRASRGFLSCAEQIVRRCEQPGTGEDVQLELPLELSH